MNIETLIYAYLAICFSMIIFNCICIFVFKYSETKIGKKSAKLENRIAEQIEKMKQGDQPDEKHKKYLCKKLKRIGNLTALDETIERMFIEEPQAVKTYLTAIRPVFLYLALEYKDRDSVIAAYYPYIIKRFHILQNKSFDLMIDTLFELLHSKSLYCRENALQALYSTGDCDIVVKALKVIDCGSNFHHSKLLTDGLLEFSGNHRKLSAALWKVFEDFSAPMKVTVLNYLRFSNPDCREEMIQLLTDGRQDDETCFACIRYFGKYHFDPAYPLLLGFAENKEERRWEYAAIASSALGIYPSDRTVKVLKTNLCSSNWYIRFNASESLEKLGLTYTDMIDIFDGNDRYAREILQYRLDQRKVKNKEAISV